MLALPTGRTVVEEVLYRCSFINPNYILVAALPDDDDCTLLHSHIDGSRWCRDVVVFRGSENDVLSRYYGAAMYCGASHIMRITSDCPCLDPVLCNAVMKSHLEHNSYASNVHPRTFPHGYDCEAFSMDSLADAHKNATDHFDREHVTPWIIRNTLRAASITQPNDESKIRLTLDTIEDYINIYRYMQGVVDAAS